MPRWSIRRRGPQRLRGAPVTLVSSLVCALVLVCSTNAAAQTRRTTTFYGGYSYLWDPSTSVLSITATDNKFVLGWMAGVEQPVWSHIGLAADVSGHYKSRTTLAEDVSLSYHALTAGPRAFGRIGPLTEFAHVLAGVAHGHASGFGVDASTTALAVQAGGGVDYPLNDRFAARLELDYRWIRGTEGRIPVGQFRAAVAIVYR